MKAIQKAVITADIVKFTSRTAEEKQIIIKHIEQIIQTLANDNTNYEIYRGDSFQGVIPIKDAVYHLLYIKSAINSIQITENNKDKIDVRISIGIGTIDYIGDKISKSEGIAFNLSGRNIDNMKGRQTLSMVSMDDIFNAKWKVFLSLAEELISDWTISSARVVNRLLQGEKESEISKHIGISQPVVNRHKKKASWYAIKEMLEYYEKHQQCS